nr:hypothetical protein [uncultured Mediterranean phage uvMED]
MPFIGNQPAESYSAFQKQDFSTSATTSYTLDNPVANANELALFINFVRQEPTTAYSASGTSLTLTSATASSDDMYCVYLGKAVQTVNPPNASVGTAQLADSSVTSAKLSGVTQGITVADQWRLTSGGVSSDGDITTNLERCNTNIQGTLGTGMSQSSGVFTFPSTGFYQVLVTGVFSGASENAMQIIIKGTSNNSSYDNLALIYDGQRNASSTTGGNSGSTIVDITNTSTHKIKFAAGSLSSGSTINGHDSENQTTFSFIRLGDT